MIHRTESDDLIFDAIVPMTRDALVGSIMRRVGAKGAAYGFRKRRMGEIGPIAAWQTENGFELRRSGLFSMPVWITLDARVEDVGAASCRVHGRVGWDPKLASERRVAWILSAAMAGWGVFWLSGVGPSAWLNQAVFAFVLLIVFPNFMVYREFYAPSVRRRAPEHRKFLVEWLERLIDAPVTVRAGGAAP